jgi:hypothetical protein
VLGTRKSRWKLEASLAALFAVGAAITGVVPDWIEAFGIEPDGGTGAAEWTIVVALGLAAVITAILSRRHYVNRLQSLGDGSQP